MELVVAKVERSVDGFERLKVNVNLMSIDQAKAIFNAKKLLSSTSRGRSDKAPLYN